MVEFQGNSKRVTFCLIALKFKCSIEATVSMEIIKLKILSLQSAS